MGEISAYGCAMLINISIHWHDPNKIPHRLNEILYGFLYVLFGFLSPFLFINDNLSYGLENNLYMFLFLAFITLDAFWWFGNFIPNMIYCKQHPEEMINRRYEDFAKKLQENHVESLKCDVSRKSLHILLMALVIGLYIYAQSNAAIIQSVWQNNWAFCKFFYTLLAFGFCNMFTLEDITRVNRFHWLPKWARKWLSTSLTPKELYTYISSIPYILSLILFQFAPVQVLFIATVVSAVGDGAASIVGKSIGKHKFPEFLDHKKSFEGLFAGMSASFITTMLVMVMFPVAFQTPMLIIAIGLATTVIFALIDLFARKIADNLLNVLLPGIAVLLLLLPFM
jgi:dolichol kinase